MTWQVLTGDCLDVLPTLPPQSVHCVVTSPPYFGLRDYGVAGQIGLESTVSEYVEKMVQVFRGVRRVLRDDGTVWLNLGDSYAASAKGTGGIKNSTLNAKRDDNGYLSSDGKSQPLMIEPFRMDLAAQGLKPKDLIGIPWRVAFALQADGWWLRSDIIWHKPNPMPESVTDRPTKAHEYLFLLTKSERYYYDSEAIAEPSTYPDDNRKARSNVDQKRMPTAEIAGVRPGSATYPTRNKRSVWTVATRPYSEAHFATYPVELVQPCIMAGTSAHGCCSVCGAPWVRVVERESKQRHELDKSNPNYRPARYTRKAGGNDEYSNGGAQAFVFSTTTGWQPSCTCGAAVAPCSVLDPFNGAATTGVAAVGLGRDYIGIELNPEYVKLSNRRLSNTQPALIGVTA